MAVYKRTKQHTGNTPAERLAYFRQQVLGIEKTEMGEKLGYPSYSHYHKVESGKLGITEDKQLLLASHYGMNLHWLITGDGPIFTTLKKESTLPAEVKGFIGKWMGAQSNLSKEDTTIANDIVKMIDTYIRKKRQ